MVLENLRSSIYQFLQENGFVHATPPPVSVARPIQLLTPPTTSSSLHFSDDYLSTLTPGQRGTLTFAHPNATLRNNAGVLNEEGGRALLDYFFQRDRLQSIPEDEVRNRIQILSAEVSQCMARGFHRAALENINHIIAFDAVLSNPHLSEETRGEVREYIQRARIQREVLRGNMDEARSLVNALHPSAETVTIRNQVEQVFRQRSLSYVFSALSAYGVIEAQHRASHGSRDAARHWQENFNTRLRTSMESVVSNQRDLHSALNELQTQEPFLRTTITECQNLRRLIQAVEGGNRSQYQLSEMSLGILEQLVRQQRFGSANELAQSLRGDFFAAFRANEIAAEIPERAQEAEHIQDFFNVLNVVSIGILPTAESNTAVLNTGAHMAAFALSGGFANVVTGAVVRGAEVAGYSGLALEGLEFGVHTATMGATVPLLSPRAERLTASAYWNEFTGMWGLAGTLRMQGMLLNSVRSPLLQYTSTIATMTTYDAATNPEMGRLPFGFQLLHSVTQDLKMRGGEILGERIREAGRRLGSLDSATSSENRTPDLNIIQTAWNLFQGAYYEGLGVLAGMALGVGMGAPLPRMLFSRPRRVQGESTIPTSSASSARSPNSIENPLESLSTMSWRTALRIAMGCGVPIRGGDGSRIFVYRTATPRNLSEVPQEVQRNFNTLLGAFGTYRSGSRLVSRLNIILDIYTRSSPQVRQNIARRIDAMVGETVGGAALSSMAYGLFRDLLNSVIQNYGSPMGSFAIRIDADPQYGITGPQFSIPGQYKHYTNRAGLDRVLSVGKILLNAPIPGRQQRVYVTDLDLQPNEVFRNIFLQNPLYRGRGGFVIGFDVSSSIFFQSGGQALAMVNGRSVFEMWSNQTLVIGRDIFIRYSGENPLLDDL